MRRDQNTQQSQQAIENIQQLGITFRLEQAHQVLSSILLSNSIYAIAVLLFSFQLSFNGNLLSVIYCIDSKLVLQLLHQIYFYRVFLQFDIADKHTLLSLISTLVEGSYLLVLNLYQISETNDLLLLANIFPLINIFLSMILKINEGNQYFKQSISQINMFHLFRNIAILIVSIFISLKLEGYLNIQWLYVLWMFWILFGVSASVVIYYVFVVLALGIQGILEQNTRQKNLVIVNFWILFFMISNTAMLLLIPISILNYHEIGNYGNIIDTARIILIINQVLFSYYTVRFKLQLVMSLQSYLSLNDSVNPLNTLHTQQGEAQYQQSNNKQDFAESQLSEHPQSIPKVVKRISKTYFGFEDLPSDKKSQTQLSGKKPTHHKALSSQIQRYSEEQNEKLKLASLINIKNSESQKSNSNLGNNSKELQDSEPRSVSLSSINSCCICFDNEPNALFMKCGHGGVCYNCAIDLWKNSEECYLCRNKICKVLQIKRNEQKKNIYQVVGATELNLKLKIEHKNLTQIQQQ